MSQPKVSIVLPVYNVEQYLRQCLDSLVNQTLSEIEIIAVNDGSPDNSILILNEYQAKYPEKMVVYTTENRGVSYARNYGLKHSNGEYVIFVDSDDYIELNMCELLYEKAHKDGNELVLCNRFDINLTESGGSVRKEIDVLPLNQNFNIKDRKFELTKISPFPWDKMFKRELIQDAKFEENLRFEDLLYVHSLLPKVKSIGVVRAPLYNYRRTNTGGFLNTFTKATLDIVIVFRKLVESYKEQGIFDYYKDEIEYLCIRHLYFRYVNFFKQGKDNGKLSLKLELIDEAANLLEEEFPDWRNNHYLKYSARKDLRENYEYYFSRNSMRRYIVAKQYMPASVIKFYERARKLPQKAKTFIARVKKVNFRKKFKKLKIVKLFNLPAVYRYTKYYEKLAVNENDILFESKHGEDLAGNMFRMLLSTRREAYDKYRIRLVVKENNAAKFSKLLESYGITNVDFVYQGTTEYFKALATAKYLATDTSFPPYFIKKDEQVYLNTWHGTPLKQMGRSVKKREYGLGNVQRNFFISDYLLYQQEFSKDIFFDEYMLDNLFDGKVLLSGYPRNSAFYMTERYEEIRQEMGISDKQIIVYMPTWRGTLNKKENDKQIKEVFEYLINVDRQLHDNQIMYIKLHPFVKDAINCSSFVHIEDIPSAYETYDFLNAIDVLVTDYSSIMFDYACSKKKIILFTYDRDEYLDGRGIYIDFNKLPFPACDTVDDLIKELSAEHKGYADFYSEFCGYDSAEVSDNVLRALVKGDISDIKTEKYDTQKTDNVLLYVNNFEKGIAAETIIPTVNKESDKKHIYVAFKAFKLAKKTAILSGLDRKVGYIPMGREKCMLLGEKIKLWLATKYHINAKNTLNSLTAFAKREAKHHFGNAKFSSIIIHSCMDRAMLKMFSCMDAEKKLYCFSQFDAKKYKKSKKYQNHIKDIIEIVSSMEIIYAPTSMIHLFKEVEAKGNTKMVYFNPETFAISDLLEEVC